MFLKFNEPFVLIANGRVIGGGRVLNPIAEPLKKQAKIMFLAALCKGEFKTAFEMLKDTHKNGFGLISAYQRFAMTHEEALGVARSLNNVFIDEEALNVYDISAVERIKSFVKFVLEKNKFAVFSAASVSLKLGWASENLARRAIGELEKAKIVTEQGGVYTKTGVDLSAAKLAPEAPYNIYDQLEIDRASGDGALKKLTAQGRVVRLAHNLFVTAKSLENAMQILREIIKTQGFVNVQNAKDRLNLSRKFIIAYLENLDRAADIAKDGQNRIFKY